MPALFAGTSARTLLQHLWSQYTSWQESCKLSFDSSLDFFRSQLSSIPPVTLLNVDQRVAQRLQLDVFSVEDILIPSLVAFAALVSLLFSLLLDCWTFRHRGLANTRSKRFTPLHALMTVLTPTSSRWPTYYLSVSSYANSGREARLPLLLSKLINDIQSGAVELRSPQHDLADLIADTLLTQGWKISLTVDPIWQLALALRLTAARLACMLPQVSRVFIHLVERLSSRLSCSAG